ncbi:MarR family transcriptional regulator [Staphylococcus sp. 18_1_E_LY]|uniref:MarR family transcriptional regulator n=1 Tax=Staphylococcus lloydii TaxID=2781774 RepID=A0A7T1AZ95_9STAP|nr:MarR family transcriptional regulator [Staphylococcus lloydii]MBF7019450.1 MarR family transcriptional regulator [Staphylococcus lloydii]MBF7027177.1 MarR family transcriptional regulator [Staphylococcus lloydii]QPM74819.1 MarR family transcriptional regulator [Staphylococcus lloydii]
MNKEEKLITEMRSLYQKIVWLNKPQMQKELKGYTATEVHCVEAIQEIDNPNVQKLSRELYMTRGAISKLTKKLIAKELIESYQRDDNKKEIYYKLTTKGYEVFAIHERLHAQFQERDRKVFENVKDEQYDAMLSFIEQYSAHLDEEIEQQEQNK